MTADVYGDPMDRMGTPEGLEAVGDDKQGDTLALFVQRELRDTHDPDATTAQQMLDAQKVMNNAARQLIELGVLFGNVARDALESSRAKGGEPGRDQE